MDVMIQSQIEKIWQNAVLYHVKILAAQLRITAQGERIAALESQIEALSAKKAPKTATKSAKKHKQTLFKIAGESSRNKKKTHFVVWLSTANH